VPGRSRAIRFSGPLLALRADLERVGDPLHRPHSRSPYRYSAMCLRSSGVNGFVPRVFHIG
jgi:hypothetical protein